MLKKNGGEPMKQGGKLLCDVVKSKHLPQILHLTSSLFRNLIVYTLAAYSELFINNQEEFLFINNKYIPSL